ncbi:grasp-with-spasm system SPASM domain peptide maturase [Arcicella rosea]|uniref:SPASM domain peptide maturase of grasp-with-spasm system n=1 Tax=Arcicella rosea TaxID=502909 RepID=A0A841ERZ4_9BACT|nr:grasp-with-spasm system SPASM domain peptide maturase [Arcicella rosea]MBB6002211.1 SPASM domain peptide maturase of grasp-with-spasm system [Arcicella rosea]
MNSAKYFCLYSCCIPVKGFKRSTICDLQRNSYMYIPNYLVDILLKGNYKVKINDKNNELNSWLFRMAEGDYGFYTDNKNTINSIRKIDLSFEEIRPITNSIIDFSPCSNHDTSEIFSQLSQLLCESVELRFFHSETVENISDILESSNDSTFRSIEVLVKYNEELHTKDKLLLLFKRCNRLLKLTLHSAVDNYIFELDVNGKIIIYVTDIIDSESHCGVISKGFFSANLPLFAEAIKYNSCLNKKISIDKNGFIRNCPSCKEDFGKFGDISLQDALNLEQSKYLWNINKEMIDDCKICEHRFMCQDCRAYIKDEKNILSKPAKCNYNPYEAAWS